MLHLYHPHYGYSDGRDPLSVAVSEGRKYNERSIAERDDHNNIGISMNKLLKERKIRVRKVVCGYCELIFLITDNSSVYVLGPNSIPSGASFAMSSGTVEYLKEPFKIIDGNEIAVREVISSSSHNLFLTFNNDLYGCGHNSRRQMFSKDSGTASLTKVTKLSIPQMENPKFKLVSSGGDFSVYLTIDNRMFTSGCNTSGQCAVDSSKDQFMTEIDYESQILALDPNANCEILEMHSCHNSTMFRTSDGKLYGFGNHHYGCLGLPEDFEREYYEISRVGGGSREFIKERCISFSCGVYFVGALTESYQLYFFGYNNFGQLSMESSNVNTPVKVNVSGPRNLNQVTSYEKVSTIVCGGYTSWIISMENNIYVTGVFKNNEIVKNFTCYNELHFDAKKSRIQISSGDFHSAILIEYDYIAQSFPKLLTLLSNRQLTDVSIHTN